jgi:hypothetical protein
LANAGGPAWLLGVSPCALADTGIRLTRVNIAAFFSIEFILRFLRYAMALCQSDAKYYIKCSILHYI